ncbi:hypothetical protein [Gordonia sp. NB41Y]|uniref:hypothetical protein n=1 Tax=Gordonia sp. NB41Y TaxID=875808 RepID=UPI0006B19240|nr:hypothetical protein [Gordonia sp. NB41Y]EMP15057.2 hypothetical protein ISGA_42 [Gordonia sp. NB41Y]WLP91336.1 hypothetical protein Q9K23_03430 [Gordonia sp. NB41Y]
MSVVIDTTREVFDDAAEHRARQLAAKLRDDVADILYLAEVWPWLVNLRVPGTRKRWAQHDMRRRTAQLTASALDAMGWQGVPRPAAADVAVLDVLAGIADVAHRIADETLQLLPQYRLEVWRPDRPASHDPRPWLHVAARLLPQAHEVTVDDLDPLAEWIEKRLGSLPDEAARLMGDVRDGQDLAGICPWCHGLTARGVGEPTLRVHFPRDLDVSPQPFDPDAPGRRADGDGPGAVIVCHGINCSPPPDACGQWWHDRPAWNPREWEWLAKRLGSPGAAS